MTTEIASIGPYEVLAWPDRLGSLGVARHRLTRERFAIKAESIQSLINEAHILHAVSGGIGIPQLHWFETIDERDVLVTDLYGPCLEEIFCKSGRYFSMQMLLQLAEPLLSRIEFIHSRNIIHGNLNPWSFALGNMEWQNQQVLLVDFNTQIAPEATTHCDLYAVGQILAYFYRGRESWEQYQESMKGGYDQETAPVIVQYFQEISSCKAKNPDYGHLKQVFHTALQDLAFHLAIALDLKGPRAITKGLPPRIDALPSMTTESLFDALNLKLSQSGRQIGRSTATLRACEWLDLLELFDDILKIYTIILLRDRPLFVKKEQFLRAYQLPNRLWRDLHWFLKRINSGTDGISSIFRRTINERAYKFISALYDIYPSYRPYWTEYLLTLARERKEIVLIDEKPVWTQTVLYWQVQLGRERA
ncbi:kinase-like domain-containing protein [Aspergillus pseudonomiae]|nr:kinase-like domain-containing protein [Aspergillus pseudonomiae]